MAIYLPVEIVTKLQPRAFRRSDREAFVRPVQVQLPAGNILLVDPADLVADGETEIDEAIQAAPPAKDWNGKER